MDYINSSTLTIKTIRDVSKEVGASFPAGQSYQDWHPIMPSDPPTAADGEVVVPAAPVRVGDGWYMGWSLRDKTSAELAAERLNLATRIAERRYLAECSGVIVGSLRVDTDDRSKLLINGAALEAVIDPAYAMQWKTRSGFVDLTGPQVIGVAQAVRAHVQACFNREAELLAELEAGTLTEEMLEQGWPV
jgi:hypothetical protein